MTFIQINERNISAYLWWNIGIGLIAIPPSFSYKRGDWFVIHEGILKIIRKLS